MARMICLCVLLLVVPLAAAEEIRTETETIFRLKVQPAAAPSPALRYRLLPDLREINPGNPIHAYLLCFAEKQSFFYDKTAVDNREKWEKLPLHYLAQLKLGQYGGAALKQADYAARLDTPDWQILSRLKEQGISTLLPDVHQMRRLAQALKVRFRMEVAEKHYDDAIFTAKTLFALSRHMGEHPTLIGQLVGIAISFVGIAPLEEMIEQPGSPNLFWALTNLPQPLVDPSRGWQGEYLWFHKEFGQVDDSAPLSDEQFKKSEIWTRLWTSLVALNERGQLQEKFTKRSEDPQYLEAARKRLVESGLKDENVRRFSPLQVTVLHEKLIYETERDEGMKWVTVPYWQAEDALRALQPERDSTKSLFGSLLPSFLKVRNAEVRLEQRFAMLRHVEAVRMYAAEHTGKLPHNLADLKLPLPVDPISGKPFIFTADGDKVVIQAATPKGLEKNPTYNIRYEVIIRK